MRCELIASVIFRTLVVRFVEFGAAGAQIFSRAEFDFAFHARFVAKFFRLRADKGVVAELGGL